MEFGPLFGGSGGGKGIGARGSGRRRWAGGGKVNDSVKCFREMGEWAEVYGEAVAMRGEHEVAAHEVEGQVRVGDAFDDDEDFISVGRLRGLRRGQAREADPENEVAQAGQSGEAIG